MGTGDPETPAGIDAPTSTDWELHNQEFYSRDVPGREAAIYQNGDLLQYPLYGLDMIGYLKSDNDLFYYLRIIMDQSERL
ncbi:MAG: hypothetical protein IPL53_23795 [Ignavibacteria bacterium]|nr:hypothetical protein [Ignavibacteria bacterium]